MKRGDFRHRIRLRVRNYEVDWEGIVHNAQYLLYFEVGRFEYLKALGVRVGTGRRNAKVVLVRNEVNYRSPARFDELLEIRTRVASIGRTSFSFEGLITEVKTGRPVADNVAVHVWLRRATGRPARVGEDFRRLVLAFEGKGVSVDPAGKKVR